MVKKGKKRGREKYKSFKIVRTKGAFLVQKKAFLIRDTIRDTIKRESKKHIFFHYFGKVNLSFYNPKIEI